jgi:O-antigen/teichoic acid export membrane protein
VAVAVVPFFTAFVSVDIRRAQRHNNYLPESVTVMAAEAMGLVGTAIGAFFARDHTAVIYGLAARALTMAVVSNLMAQRPYRIAFSAAEAQRFSGFAAPLILNGILLFVGSQGDRLLVGRYLGAAALGHYSAVLLLVFYPTSALMTFVMGMHLPPLSASRDDPARWAREKALIGGRAMLIAMFLLSGFALVGPLATPIFYGARFAQAPSLFAVLGCFQAMRFLRTWPTTVAVSLGRSTIVMWGNVARMVALPAAFVGALVHPGPEAVAGGFFLGETVALVVALTLLARTGAISLGQELARAAAYLLTAGLVFGAAWTFEARLWTPAAALACGVVGWLGWIAWRERMVIAGLFEILRRRVARA